ASAICYLLSAVYLLFAVCLLVRPGRTAAQRLRPRRGRKKSERRPRRDSAEGHHEFRREEGEREVDRVAGVEGRGAAGGDRFALFERKAIAGNESRRGRRTGAGGQREESGRSRKRARRDRAELLRRERSGVPR